MVLVHMYKPNVLGVSLNSGFFFKLSDSAVFQHLLVFQVSSWQIVVTIKPSGILAPNQ